MAARCETVLNTTMAEIDTYHTQKNEDFKSLTTDILDDEIALYEQVSVTNLYVNATLENLHAFSTGSREVEKRTQNIRRSSIQPIGINIAAAFDVRARTGASSTGPCACVPALSSCVRFCSNAPSQCSHPRRRWDATGLSDETERFRQVLVIDRTFLFLSF